MQPFLATLGPIADLLSSTEREEFVRALELHGLRCVRPRVPLDQLPFETAAVPWTNLGRFLLNSQVRPGSFLQFAAGDYAVQDAASLLPLSLMQLRPGQRVIDCCAAPGGKSAAILEQLAGEGLLISNEVIASRVDTLQLTLARTGYSNYLITHQPVDRLVPRVAEQLDCVLVDAPCSGQSLVGRGKQSLSAFSDHQVAHSAARQQSILEAAMEMVRPGGRLVYSTCTFAFAENEGIVSWLRERLPDWLPLELEELAQWQTPGFAGCYRLWPQRDRCAGGFAAALIRPEHAASEIAAAAPNVSGASTSKRRTPDTWQPADDLDMFAAWGEVHTPTDFYHFKQQVALFEPSIPAAWRAMAHCGIEAATKFGEHWQPAYPLAVLNPAPSSPTAFTARQVTALGDQEARTYFTGTSVHRTGPEGWQVVTWQGRPLGWAKQVGTQLKNHLPKPLRQPNLQ